MTPASLESLRAQLMSDEGLRLKPYGDLKGKITIGFGHNLTDNGITHEDALRLLDGDIETTLALVRVNWPPFGKLDEVRQQALGNMAFNIGVGTFMTFKQMLAAAAVGDFKTAAREIRNSHYALQVGPRAQRIAFMMEHGE